MRIGIGRRFSDAGAAAVLKLAIGEWAPYFLMNRNMGNAEIFGNKLKKAILTHISGIAFIESFVTLQNVC